MNFKSIMHVPTMADRPIGAQRLHAVAPHTRAVLCDACTLRVAPAALLAEAPGFADPDRYGRRVYTHAQWVAHTPHVEPHRTHGGSLT